MPAIYGLIGYPLTHSFSPGYFNAKFKEQCIDAVYRAFELGSIEDLTALLSKTPGIRGLNVTIPYKTSVLHWLDELSPEAAAIGAVNCIDVNNGILKGHNTDAVAFENSLKPLLKSHHKSALVLGTGGASRAVRYALGQLGIDYQLVSMEREKSTITYNDVTPELLKNYLVVINTTPLGMYPHMESFPALPYETLEEQHLLYDLIYNPEETRFLQLGRLQGAAVKNGYEMLALQAEASWNIWNKKQEPR